MYICVCIKSSNYCTVDCPRPKKEKKVKSEPAVALQETGILLSSKDMEIVTRVITILF